MQSLGEIYRPGIFEGPSQNTGTFTIGLYRKMPIFSTLKQIIQILQ